MLIYPFVQCLAALTILWVWRLCRSQGVVWGRLVALVLLAGVVATAGFASHRMQWYVRRVNETGGLGYASSQISELARWIDENPSYHYVFPTWALYAPVFTLTQGRCSCTPYENVGGLRSGKPFTQVANEAKKAFSRRDSVFVFTRADPWCSLTKRNLFRFARSMHLEPQLIKQFHCPNTTQILYEAYTFQSPNEMRLEDISWRNISLDSVRQKTGGAMDPGQSVINVSNTENRAVLRGVTDTTENIHHLALYAPFESSDQYIRFQVGSSTWKHCTVLRIQLLAAGKVVTEWTRGLLWFPMIESKSQVVLGPNLYPQFFQYRSILPDAEAVGLRILITSERQGVPLNLEITDLQVGSVRRAAAVGRSLDSTPPDAEKKPNKRAKLG